MTNYYRILSLIKYRRCALWCGAWCSQPLWSLHLVPPTRLHSTAS